MKDLQRDWAAKEFRYFDLPSGRTHYHDSGADNPTNVVLIHGVSGPMSAWDFTMKYLKYREFNVVRYDLFGRGYSARKQEAYDLDLYIRQLSELLAKKQFERSILVGSSFGSVIAAEFANRFPDRVQGLVLIGPAGFPIEVPPLAKLRDLPILGNVFFRLLGKSVILEQNRKYFVDSTARSKHMPYYEAQLQVRGSGNAILSTMRKCPVQDYLEGYAKLHQHGIPIKVIWGKEDQTFPYANHVLMRDKLPDMELFSIENSAHLPMYERPELVNELVLKILRSLK